LFYVLFRSSADTHFSDTVAEIDFVIHVPHGVGTPLGNCRGGNLVVHFKFRGKEVLCPKTNASLLAHKLLVKVQSIYPESALGTLKLHPAPSGKTKGLDHPSICDIVVTEQPSADNKALIGCPIRIHQVVVKYRVVGINTSISAEFIGKADVCKQTQAVCFFTSYVFVG